MRIYVDLGGEEHILLAKKVASNLEQTRVQLNLPVMNKRYAPDPDTTVAIVTNQFDRTIRIHHLPAGNMLFCRRSGDQANVFSYDYLTKRLTTLASITVGEGALELLPFHDTHSHLTSPTGSDGYIKTTHSGSDITFEGEGEEDLPALIAFRIDRTNGREYAVAMVGPTPVLYARTPGTAFRKAATFPERIGPEGQTFQWAISEGDDPRAFQISGGMVYLGGYWKDTELWNLFNGYEFFAYDPKGIEAPIYQWFSELWFAEPGEFESPPGIKWFNIYGPYEEATSEFGCLLDDRSGVDGPGHCEMLVTATYLDGFEDVDYSMRMVLTNAHTVGATQPFVVDLSEHLSNNPSTYHYWSAVGDPKDETPTTGQWGVLVSQETGKWALHDHPGYSRQTIGGAGYKFHTVSADGNMAFVVEANVDGERGVMLDLLTGEITYHPLVAGAESGCFISPEDKNSTPITFLGTIADSDTITTDPAMGEVRPGISRSITMNNDHWKVETSDPFTARGYIWNDLCWEWTATAVLPSDSGAIVEIGGIEYPIGQAPYNVGSTYDNEILFGVFSKEDSKITVEAIEVKPKVAINSIKNFAHPIVALDLGVGYPEGTLVCEFCQPPCTWDSNLKVVEPYDQEILATGNIGLPIDESECPGGGIDVSITDACGREAEHTTEDVTNIPFFISGAPIAVVGESYTASEGVSPYSWDISKGTIDSVTGEILTVPTLTDSCNPAVITAIDKCGNVTTKGVDFSPATALAYTRIPSSGLTRPGHSVNVTGGNRTINFTFESDDVTYTRQSAHISIATLTTNKPGCYGQVDWYGSVTAIDGCGRELTISGIYFEAGSWQVASIECCEDYFFDPSCVSPWPGCGGNDLRTTISGNTKTVEYWRHASGCISDYCQSSVGPNCPRDTSGEICYMWWQTITYTWECPDDVEAP